MTPAVISNIMLRVSAEFPLRREKGGNIDIQILTTLLNMKIRSEEVIYELSFAVVGSYYVHRIPAGDEGHHKQRIESAALARHIYRRCSVHVPMQSIQANRSKQQLPEGDGCLGSLF